MLKEIQVRALFFIFNLSQELHLMSNNFLPETLKAQPSCVNYICTANQSAAFSSYKPKGKPVGAVDLKVKRFSRSLLTEVVC